MPELSRNNKGGIASKGKALGKTILGHTPFGQQKPERRTGLLAAAAGTALAIGGLIALNVISRRKPMPEGPTDHITFTDTVPAPMDGHQALSQPGAHAPAPAPIERRGGLL